MYNMEKIKKYIKWKIKAYDKKKKTKEIKKKRKDIFYKSWYYIIKFRLLKSSKSILFKNWFKSYKLFK